MESTSHLPQQPAPSSPRPVAFTEAAISKIRQFLENKEEARDKHLRIFVQGGGCSGFEYGFTFDVEKEGDLKLPQGDIEVLVDMFSMPYLEGSQVDYTESLMGSGFSVTNPNAKGTCGCGHSFTT
jgi:iron-sulfur cluster insertion protein